jgi:oligosaccharide repeat unit polymerase
MIAIIGAIVSAQRVFKNYNLSFLLKNPAYLQFMGFQQQYVGYMNVLGIMVFPMFCYYFIITKQIKFFDIICVSLAFLGLFLAGIKTYIVISVITALLIYVQLTPKIRIKYILIATVVCIGFFIFYENYIDIYKTPIGSLNFSSFLKSLEAPYSYITSGWVAFSHFGLEGTGNVFPYKGYVVLSSVFKILSFLGLTDKEPFQPLEFVSVGEGIMTNVYTMVGEVYLDVGPIGLAVVYFILGTICSYVYNISLKERNLSATFISALLMYGLFISFFSYYYHFHLLFLCVSTYAVISISKYTLLRKKEEI